jgi:FkbM family methyltransferase
MKSQAKACIQLVLSRFGFAIVPIVIQKRHNRNPKFSLLSRWFPGGETEDLSAFVLKEFWRSKSQLQQDLVALYVFNKIESIRNEKSSGFFVEFGATNGLDLSNTFLLESDFGWSGILAEPALLWHKQLFENRRCRIDLRCVYSESGKHLEFQESKLPELSTLSKFSSKDVHKKNRVTAKMYDVETVTLRDLLTQNQAPYRIDYLSIDTEGSEIDVIRDFDFGEWDIRLISVEITSDLKRKQVIDILNHYGYRQILSEFSEWEAWFLKNQYLVEEFPNKTLEKTPNAPSNG